MTPAFLIGAIVIVVAAAAPLMIALLGRDRPGEEEREAARARAALAAARAAGVLSQEEYEAKHAALPPAERGAGTPVAGTLALVIGIAIPAAALALYQGVGEPRALDPAAHSARPPTTADGAPAPDMATALAGLEQRLQQNPDDAAGWSLLARGYQSAQQFDKALEAMRRVRDLMPEDLDAQVGYAEALALAAPGRRVDEEASVILEAALARDRMHQRALWLSGIAAMQRGDGAAAASHWRALEAQLPEGSEIRATLAEQIRNAEGGAPPVADASTAAEGTAAGTGAETAPPAAGNGASVTIGIRLDPALQDKVQPGDTLFVFARAADGPRMPLAIQRRSAGELPLMITLDDSMSMMPTMKLSSFDEIVIGARISRSGNAAPVSGDLQALTQPMQRSAIKDAVQITIDEVVP
jgi:cytochrome c-type biogenesis protein CcmH